MSLFLLPKKERPAAKSVAESELLGCRAVIRAARPAMRREADAHGSDIPDRLQFTQADSERQKEFRTEFYFRAHSPEP
jgi:hypothetical protein